MSMAERDGLIWFDGKMVDWRDARLHVLTHSLHYGMAVFEGVRAYKTEIVTAIFRLKEHTDRFFNSAKIYWMELPWSLEQLNEAILETIQVNRLQSCYIRPVAYRGFGQLGVNPLDCPVEVAILVWEWGKYLGAEALEQGVDVCVSSWNRLAPNTLPAMAKTAANYMNSQLIKVDAVKGGFVEGIALDTQGFVSEGSGENIFVVSKGRLITPPLVSSVLPGITRDTVITLAGRLGVPVDEKAIPREMLYLADELFFTGTAAEVTPIRSVDRRTVGAGKRGPITESLQKAFFDVIEGRTEDEHGWLTPVPTTSAVAGG